MMDENFRGNIYIVQNGKALYESENGFADLPNEIPNTIETKFASASAGKAFDQYLKEHVFDVCGMKATGYYELDKLDFKSICFRYAQ